MGSAAPRRRQLGTEASERTGPGISAAPAGWKSPVLGQVRAAGREGDAMEAQGSAE